MRRPFTWMLLTVTLAAAPCAQEVSFNRDVRPVLAENCFFCHGPDAGRRKGKLRLDIAEGAFAPREDRPAIAPGDPDGSELIARITAADPKERMPPVASHKKLAPAEIETLRRWIEQGAAYQAHWAYVAPVRVALPTVRDAAWGRGFVDRWVLAGLERAGLAPSPPADRVTLARRLYFDLLGMPPPIAAVDAFVADGSEGAYERMVDELLASPHYGERMAMYWLDLVRYADTVGYHGDQEHHIAAYRDWVIGAFNDNMRFDRFTVEQLAGDLLPEPTVEQKIATGYNRVLQTTHEGGAQPKEYLAIYAADRVRNVSAVWMGATLGCAQCHDHKYDPFTARDFYAMQAFFADIDEKGDFKGSPNSTPTTRPPEMLLPTAEQAAEMARFDRELAAARTRGDRAAVEQLTKQRRAARKRIRRTLITVAVEPRVTRVLPRGDWLDESGEIVEPAVPHFLPPIDTEGRRATRLDLARWLVSADNPLTARVFVNRLWYLFFGRGLSARLDDLGAQGAWPEHPELLDALALAFVESGWDVKAMVRAIVTSKAYRQASFETPELRRADPVNLRLARQGRWRVPAEVVRDTALSIAGLLVRDVGGDSVKPYQPAGYYRHLNFPVRRYQPHEDRRQWRRGVYVHWQRMFLHPALLAFDAPKREECTAQRATSNTPQAALALLNDPTFVEAARAFAARILRAGLPDDDARLEFAARQAWSRVPQPGERAVLTGLLERHRRVFAGRPDAAAQLIAVGLAPVARDLDAIELAAWTSVSRALLSSNETLTRN